VTRVQSALSSTAYALFALEQTLSLREIEIGARVGAFPAATTHTPEWFSAAAEGSTLLQMAPELQVLPADLEEAGRVDLTGIDLISVYAPELMALDEAEEPEVAEPTPAPASVERPRTSMQIGLLKELGNLDD
jgi:hypothetical protein